MSKPSETAPEQKLESTGAIQRKEANTCIGAGVGVGLFGAGAAALGGAVCPLCIIATPLLIGIGLYKRFTLKPENSNDGK